jgi:hypothetical protein
MPDAKHRLPDAAAREKLQLVGNKRTPRDLDQGLRDRFGDRVKPSPQTTGQNRDRRHRDHVK